MEGECHHFARQISTRVAEEGETPGAGVFLRWCSPTQTNHQNALTWSRLSAPRRLTELLLLWHLSWRKIQGSQIQVPGILLSITELYFSSVHLKLRLYYYVVIAICWLQRLKGRHVRCNLKDWKNMLSYIFFPSVGLKINIELVCFQDRGTENLVRCLFLFQFPPFSDGDCGNRQCSIIIFHWEGHSNSICFILLP